MCLLRGTRTGHPPGASLLAVHVSVLFAWTNWIPPRGVATGCPLKMMDDNRDHDNQHDECQRAQHEIGVAATELDIRAWRFRDDGLLYLFLALLALIYTLLRFFARWHGRGFAVWAGAHMLHAAAHIAVICLCLLLRARILRCGHLFGPHGPCSRHCRSTNSWPAILAALFPFARNRSC